MGHVRSSAGPRPVEEAGRFSYGEATGITQTIRDYAASLGVAVLGTALVSRMRTNVANELVADPVHPMTRAAADKAASNLAQMKDSGSGAAPDLSKIPHFYQLAFDRRLRRPQGRRAARAGRGHDPAGP